MFTLAGKCPLKANVSRLVGGDQIRRTTGAGGPWLGRLGNVVVERRVRTDAAGSIATLLVEPGDVGTTFAVTREELGRVTPQQHGEAAVTRTPSSVPPQ